MTFTRNVVTGSRSLSTTYQNATGNALLVGITIAGSATGTAFLKVDSTNPPSFVVNSYGTDTGLNRYMFAVVAPGEYYMATVDSGGSLTAWVEWTTDLGVTRTNPTRAFGTVYQNTSGTPLIISAWGFHDSTDNRLKAYVGATSSPATLVASGHSIFDTNLSFIVLPNQYYKIVDVNSTLTLAAWTEWQMTGMGTLYLNNQTSNRSQGSTSPPPSPVGYLAPGAMFICINDLSTTSPFDHSILVYSDGSANPPTTLVARQTAIDAVDDYSVFVPIVSGERYAAAVNSNNALDKWMEWSPVQFIAQNPIMEFVIS